MANGSAQVVVMIVFGLLGIVLLSFVATLVYALRHPDLGDQLQRLVDALERDTHADGQPCSGDDCQACAQRAEHEREAGRLMVGLAFMWPAALLFMFGPRAGRWLLHGRSDREPD